LQILDTLDRLPQRLGKTKRETNSNRWHMHGDTPGMKHCQVCRPDSALSRAKTKDGWST